LTLVVGESLFCQVGSRFSSFSSYFIFSVTSSEALARIHYGERGVYPLQGNTATKIALGILELEDNRTPSAIFSAFS
jgi:hypothetical protein